MHLIKNRGWTGSIIKTVSCSVILNRFAKEYNLKLIEEPVGFKYIVPYLISGEALVGTEESGGLGIQNHIPERDGSEISERQIGIPFPSITSAAIFANSSP